MKKLRVILPAILTLAVSTSAAVTGTVAWFTATRLKTVTMTGITVVNPEQGLKLVEVADVANVNLTNVNNDGTPVEGSTPGITHLMSDDGTPAQLYLRDASYNISSGTVYRGVLDEKTGELDDTTPYGEATKGADDAPVKYVDFNNKTFKGNKVVYATQYTLSFQSTTNTTNEDTFENRLFLDIGASTFNIKEDAAAVNPELNKALRVAFKTDGEAFVWAPFADDYSRDYTITSANFDANKANLYTKSGSAYSSASEASFTPGTPYYRAIASYTYVSGANATTPYVAATNNNTVTANANFIKGEITETTSTLLQEGNDGNITNANGTGYIGHLGTLSTTSRVITVTTWFEGTDPNCVNDSFGGSLDNIEAELKFVMRRVTKGA